MKRVFHRQIHGVGKQFILKGGGEYRARPGMNQKYKITAYVTDKIERDQSIPRVIQRVSQIRVLRSKFKGIFEIGGRVPYIVCGFDSPASGLKIHSFYIMTGCS